MPRISRSLLGLPIDAVERSSRDADSSSPKFLFTVKKELIRLRNSKFRKAVHRRCTVFSDLSTTYEYTYYIYLHELDNKAKSKKNRYSDLHAAVLHAAVLQGRGMQCIS